METTRRLNFLARTLGSDIMLLSWVELTIDELEEWRRGLDGRVGGRGVVDGMGEFVAFLRNVCQVTLVRAEFQTKRKEALIQMVSCGISSEHQGR